VRINNRKTYMEVLSCLLHYIFYFSKTDAIPLRIDNLSLWNCSGKKNGPINYKIPKLSD
jgi:hypothetical protein